MTTFAFALAYLGMLALCLALTRHHRSIFSTAPTPERQRWRRAAAAGLLLGTAVVDATSLGVAIGLVVCLAQLMLAGLTVSLTLAWRERWVVPLGALLSLLGVLFAVGGG